MAHGRFSNVAHRPPSYYSQLLLLWGEWSAQKYSELAEILTDLQTVWFIINVMSMAMIQETIRHVEKKKSMIKISMQYNNYTFDVYKKLNRLKIGWKLSKLWLFK